MIHPANPYSLPQSTTASKGPCKSLPSHDIPAHHTGLAATASSDRDWEIEIKQITAAVS
jgi:hypothetical protein